MSNVEANQIALMGWQTNREPCVLTTASLLETQADALLKSHAHFRGQNHWVKFRCLNGCLYLSGKLPSYYLKQLAQEAIREIEGITSVENRIMVESPVGEEQSGEKQMSTWRKPR